MADDAEHMSLVAIGIDGAADGLAAMASALSPEPWASCHDRRAASSCAGSTRMSRLRMVERAPSRRRTRKRFGADGWIAL